MPDWRKRGKLTVDAGSFDGLDATLALRLSVLASWSVLGGDGLFGGPGWFIVRELRASNSAGQPMNNRSEQSDEEADQRRSAALIGLIIILALAIAGVVLVRELRERSRLEDCLMSGRTNCAPIELPLRR